MRADCKPATGHVDLYWIPLGAGMAVPVVTWSGRAYEAFAARRAGRPACNLFHAALEIWLDDQRFTLEMAPAWGRGHGTPGVIGQSSVGLRPLGRSRFFRYEIRRCPDGVIPDLAFAAPDPQRVCTDATQSQAVYDSAARVPLPTWGRDDLNTGDMWNSNSLVSWSLTQAGVDIDDICPPAQGRAPGWSAGVVAARRNRRA